MRHPVRAGLMVTGLAASIVLGGAAVPTSATGTAQVRIVDNYPYGRIVISINGLTRRMSDGDRTGFLSVTPDPHGNDGMTVRRVKDPGCGIAVIGKYFSAGHRYRVRVNQYHGGRCKTAGGRSIGGPTPHVSKID